MLPGQVLGCSATTPDGGGAGPAGRACGARFSLYALAALLPLLPAKQRDTDPADWMSIHAEVACPGPHCGARFRVTRTGRRAFTHAGTTGLPDARGAPWWRT